MWEFWRTPFLTHGIDNGERWQQSIQVSEVPCVWAPSVPSCFLNIKSHMELIASYAECPEPLTKGKQMLYFSLFGALIKEKK